MWNLPRPGTEPMFSALEGEFLTTGPPGKSSTVSFWGIGLECRTVHEGCSSCSDKIQYYYDEKKKNKATTQTSVDHFFKRVDRTEFSKEPESVSSGSGMSEIVAYPPSHVVDHPSAHHFPPPLPSPVSNSSCLFIKCQPLCASYCTILLYFSRYWKVVAGPRKTPGFLASRGEEFNLGPQMKLGCSELLCNKVLWKYKRDRESFWHRHQKGAERVPPC